MTTLSRRKFLGKSALAAGLAPLALSSLSSPFIRSAHANEPGANAKVRLGLIGSGEMGQGDLECFFLNPEVDCVVVCDVDDARIAKGVELCQKHRGKKPDTVKDFRRVLDRKDVDVVLIATPDHWHALPAVLACQAGKDVYVEKPLAKTIDEGRAMLEAAKRHNRVVQMGSQWRSCQHMIEAGELVRSGKLGKVGQVRAWAYLDWLPSIGKQANCAPPAGVDYDMWLGPAPQRPFNPNRFHFNFRWFWDYAGGLMTDWGVHLINMMLMGMSTEPPRAAFASGGKFVLDDDSETPDSQIVVYEFPSYTMIWEHKAGLNNGLNNRPWGIQWSGTEGAILLNDSGWEIVTERKRANLDSQKKPGSGNPRPPHVRNFLDCVKSRQQPVLNLELGHHLSSVAHLGNIAYRTGRKVVWDPVKERIVDDHQADKLVGVKYRKPWSLPYARRS
ncbi:MAG TPA: Gfo/Idh/MocA family oxidoreductase [Candidatus Sulfotelmatobacter sp.]|nr:Gfo/Idh/MocA family oxidoreductase [Candidatus Sulfotelmatobacter sp.]